MLQSWRREHKTLNSNKNYTNKKRYKNNKYKEKQENWKLLLSHVFKNLTNSVFNVSFYFLNFLCWGDRFHLLNSSSRFIHVRIESLGWKDRNISFGCSLIFYHCLWKFYMGLISNSRNVWALIILKRYNWVLWRSICF